MRFIAFLLLFVSMAVVGCSPDPPVSGDPDTAACDSCVGIDLAAQLDAAIRLAFEGSPVPGLVVAADIPGEGRYIRALGNADISSGAPMTPNAVFGIGSVHKLVKWITAHLLIQDGELSLDDLVNDYVDRPSLPGVTIRDLMRHSSGMPDIVDVAEFMSAATSDQTRQFTYDEMIGFLEASSGQNGFGPFEQGRLVGFEPGIDMSYSSFGPVVLGEVLRTITGRTMQDLVDETIIDRLGLANTSHMGLEPDPAGLTPGYADAETPNPFFPDAASTLSFSTANGGAMHSTAEDLLDFIVAIFGNAEFLEPAAVSALTADALNGAGMSSGLGVLQFDAWRSRGLWGHAGFGIRSHSATVLHQPETGVSVVVLTNLNAELDQYETNLAVTESILEVLSG